jgi:tetratricopeptide (TPR) repeat protein
MGAVYQGLDRVVGGHVALKIVKSVHGGDTARFREEARILAQLRHSAIVRYLTHGPTADGNTFLAMEWLDGADLQETLATRRLAYDETFVLATRVAEALAITHASGVAHRDIKPSNLFLPAKDPARVKVIDFGIARQYRMPRLTTRTGVILGTVGYMAPEQAKGSSDIGPAADVFSLGCVLFECLTGRPAFVSKHDVAVVAKVLLEDAPRAREFAPEVPHALDELIARMLAKEPRARPASGLALFEELRQIRAGADTSQPSRPPALTRIEQLYTTILLLEYEDPRTGRGDGETLVTPHDPRVDLSLVTNRMGVEVTSLGHRVVLITPTTRAGGADAPTHAASCALRLRGALPGTRIVMATGLADTSRQLPTGPAIERAVAMLRDTAPPDASRHPIVLDEVTANLLESRFEIEREGASTILVQERGDEEWSRTVLGRRTPCVGRERELAVLATLAAGCFDGSGADALLVTGPPGIGKSRLRREFVTHLRQRGIVKVWVARGDPVAARAPRMIAPQLIRAAPDVRAGGSIEDQRARLYRYLAEGSDGGIAPPGADFIVELLEAGAEAAPGSLLRAARDDSRIMNEWMRRSFVDWLRAESAGSPVVLVLEDLHWGDLPSVNFLDHALRELGDAPILLVAFSRPTAHEVFPKLRTSLIKQEIILGGLSRRAAERLARAVLGDSVRENDVARIVRLADGNAFFIEELSRRFAADLSHELPDTILAVVGARLQALPAEARAVLRAASVFGNTFWLGGVAALVRGFGPGLDVTAQLHALIDLEIVSPGQPEAFAGDQGYVFRHDLLREASYAMLTDVDREHGHLLAAEWLLQLGAPDALVLADHYDRGRRIEEAVPWFLRAAEVALHTADIDKALDIAERGKRGATGETLGRFLEIEQIARSFRGDWLGAFESGARAMLLLRPGSTSWFRSAGSAMLAGVYLGRPETALQVLQTSAGSPTPDPSGPFGLATFTLIGTLLHAGARQLVLQIIDRLETAGRSQADHDLVFSGWLCTARCISQLFVAEGIGLALKLAAEGLRRFEGAGDLVGWLVAALYYGIAHIEAGQTGKAQSWLREVISRAGNSLLPISDFARYYLARVEAHRSNTELAEQLLSRPPGVADGARGFLADTHARNGDFARAEIEANQITTSASVYARVTGLAVLARIALAAGRHEEALARIERAIEEQDRGSAVPFWRSTLLVLKVQALDAGGDRDAARRVLRDAVGRLQRIAATFEDRDMGETYLRDVEPNAMTVDLAAEWLTAEPS